VPNLDVLRSYAELKGVAFASDAELIQHPRILDLMQRQVDKYTAELGQWERVKRIALLERELTIESGDLTPTLKARRSVIENRYAAIIDQLYADAQGHVTASARQ
jgi:long-chain acyl-CoA synthetase